MTDSPPGFSDDELAIVREAAHPSPHERRSEFLEMVAASLQSGPRTPGAVLQSCAAAQRHFLTATVGPSKYR